MASAGSDIDVVNVIDLVPAHQRAFPGSQDRIHEIGKFRIAIVVAISGLQAQYLGVRASFVPGATANLGQKMTRVPEEPALPGVAQLKAVLIVVERVVREERLKQLRASHPRFHLIEREHPLPFRHFGRL